MRKHHIVAGMLAIATFASCKKDLNPNSNPISDLSVSQSGVGGPQEMAGEDYVPNELLVKFKKGMSETGRANALAKISANAKEHVVTKMMQKFGDNEGFFVLTTPHAVMEAVGIMKSLPEVEYAEPNFIYRHSTTTTDSYFTGGTLWGMYSSKSPSGSGDPINQYGSQANTAWANGHTGSSAIAVGVIDEGVNYVHPDLAGNIWTNAAEAQGTAGVDDDGDGYIDDVHGYDFANNDGDVYDAGADDHGTHVSGTIGALANNGGVVGVNWNVTIVSAKFLGPNGGSLANAVKALDYLTMLKQSKGLNIVANNNSWGGGSYSQALYDAIERSNQANILFIAAAGNGNQVGIGQNNDKKANYPSNYTNSNVIAVAAIDKNGSLASFSNYGATTVDIGAPGVAITSTVPGGYASYSGTSMATPHVTGAAALYASTHSGATVAQIKSAILSTATPTASLKSKCVTGGRLNVSSF